MNLMTYTSAPITLLTFFFSSPPHSWLALSPYQPQLFKAFVFADLLTPWSTSPWFNPSLSSLF